MKCAKLTDIGKLEIIETQTPEIGPGQLLIQMKSVGICGSDVHYYKTGRIGSDKAKFPQTLGHECAGQIITVSTGSKFKEGTRVAVEPALPCMSCEQCVTGHYNCCPNVKFLGSPGMPGALQEYLVVHESQVHEIPDEMNWDEAAILEPLGVAYHTVKLSKIHPGQTVALFGSGPIGLLTLAMFKAAGAGETFIFDKIQERLDFAKNVYGADHAINVNHHNPIDYIKAHTKNRGVDIACEASGKSETFNWTFEAARICGLSLVIGIPEVDAIAFNPHTMRRKELTIQNVRRSNLALAPCIDIVKRGVVKIEKLATHHYSLDNVKDAFDTVDAYADGVIRAIVTF